MVGRKAKDISSVEKMKDALENAIECFNKSIRDYLKENLQTEGEEKIADKMWFHLGIYSSLEESMLTKYMNLELNSFSFAITYYDQQRNNVLGVRKEELQNKKWWERKLETENEKMVIKEKEVNNSIYDRFVGKIVLVLVGEIKAETILLRERLLLEVIMDILSELLNDIFDIKEIEKLLKKREQGGYVSLIGAYTAKVFQHYQEDKRPMLEEKDCIQLSHEKYEGRERPARIYIGADKAKLLAGKRKNGEMICWKNNWENALEEEKNRAGDNRSKNRRIRFYRKMMELCKSGKSLITCFNEQGKINIFGAVDQKWLSQNGYKLYIDFKCNGEWYVKDGEEEVLCYIKGVYYYSKSGIVQNYKTQLKEEINLESGMAEKFSEIIVCMSRQEHGAGMIIAENADNIAENFCIKYKRGIVLNKKLDLTDDGNMEFLLGMTSVDGMLLVDKKGICYAFGVILDGKAEVEANPARGSRYNSALNYIYDKEESCAVIISEDKTVDIVGKSIRKRKELDISYKYTE